MWRELANVGTTLAGYKAGSFIGEKTGLAMENPALGAILSGGLAITGAYVGNIAFNKPPEEKVKDKIHDRASLILASQGIDQASIDQAFEDYKLQNPIPKNGMLRNTGNVATTLVGGGIGNWLGLLASTALCTGAGKGLDAALGAGNKYASYGFVAGMLAGPVIGTVTGAYAGNKLFSMPKKQYIEEEAKGFAQKILDERDQQNKTQFASYAGDGNAPLQSGMGRA